MITYIIDIHDIFSSFFNSIVNPHIYYTDHIINSNYNDFIIKNLSMEHLDFISINVSFASKCLDNLDISFHNNNPSYDHKLWKLCIIDKIFFNLPFTLDDIIFIPISYIISTFNSSVSKKFSKTLIHEKIHLLQRFNIPFWTNFIHNNSNWSHIHSNLIYNSSLFNSSQIYNPDTYYLNDIFILNVDDKYFYAHLIYNKKKSIQIQWYQVIVFNSENLLLFPTNLNILKYEHPFEQFAYSISNDLINSISSNFH